MPGPSRTADSGDAADVDLEPEIQKSITDLHGRLDRVDYYVLLGIERTADRKAVKRAYYEAAAKFHPDKHFRKKLGPFKAQMEAIFARLTVAHDTLSDPSKRTEYDAYVQAQRRSRSIEDLMADALSEVRRVEENVERQARQEAAPVPPPSGAPAGVARLPQTAASSRPPSPSIDAAARREALARRLLGGSRPSQRPAASTPAAENIRPAPSTADAMDALRRRYEERLLRARESQGRTYLERARAASASGDPVAAANALRVAQGLLPNDADIERQAKEAQAQADALLGETYAEQAEYEEKTAHWTEAARSWARACKIRGDDLQCHERAAHAILKAGGDLHEAARLGRRACEIDPASASAHVTLAHVYATAGLTLNASRELETAAQLAPQDGTIREMIAKLGRQV